MKVKQILHLLEGDIHFTGAPKQYCMGGINSDKTPDYSVYEWEQKLKKPKFEALANCTVEGIKSTGFGETVVFVREGRKNERNSTV